MNGDGRAKPWSLSSGLSTKAYRCRSFGTNWDWRGSSRATSPKRGSLCGGGPTSSQQRRFPQQPRLALVVFGRSDDALSEFRRILKSNPNDFYGPA